MTGKNTIPTEKPVPLLNTLANLAKVAIWNIVPPRGIKHKRNNQPLPHTILLKVYVL